MANRLWRSPGEDQQRTADGSRRGWACGAGPQVARSRLLGYSTRVDAAEMARSQACGGSTPPTTQAVLTNRIPTPLQAWRLPPHQGSIPSNLSLTGSASSQRDEPDQPEPTTSTGSIILVHMGSRLARAPSGGLIVPR